MGGHFLPSFIMFFWDYVSHKLSNNLMECNMFYFSDNLGIALIFVIFKFIIFFFGPYSIYYIFYWQNRKKF
jgi:hypothetical protein